jgi:guanyl-specific ribonuclease Sa
VATAKATAGSTGAKTATTRGSEGVDPDSGLRWVAESSLPKEAKTTLALIRAGGPYPYPRNDDQTFSNREAILPKRANGYYREYTVVTPGSDDRGARRIIRGREGELYYTDDHYGSFRRVREGA